jgi:PAS domain S-box-containing protein
MTLLGVLGSVPLFAPGVSRQIAPPADPYDDAFAITEQERAWLRLSHWTIVIVLGLLLCLILALAIFGLSYLDVQPGHTYEWHFRPYRLPAAVVMALSELALICAILVRDGRRQRVERRLRESDERMSLATDAAGLGLWQWDAASDQFWMNRQCREILGLAPGGKYGLAAIAALVHPDDMPAVTRAVAQALPNETAVEIQHRIVPADGHTRWIRSRGRPTHDAEGLMTRLAGTAVDVTERVAMQAEIERQRQSLVHLTRVGAIGELSGALAHELNQPLTAILSNAQAIQRMIAHNPINIEELRGAIADIIDDDSRAGDVIRHLRALLKKDEVRREPVAMDQLINKVTGLVRNELISRNIFPVVKMGEDRAFVMGDAVQLQQLLLNLVFNAIEAISVNTPEKNGVIIITGVLEDKDFHLSVSDTGPGIKPEFHEKLFEPFFSTKKQGLGLGLSICHAIVESHGGTIRVENNSWGGASFHIFLPHIRPLSP